MKAIHLGLLAIAIGACAHQSEIVLVPDFQLGPANMVPAGRVLALRASCGSVEYRCPKEFGQTVDSIVRGGLEFAGYAVVDDESLRNQTRQRHEEHVATTTDASSRTRADTQVDLLPIGHHVTTEGSRRGHSETDTIVLDGASFEDLSVDERHEVLTKSGADSVASVRIVVGGQAGLWVPNQNVEVMVKLGAQQGDAMAWASRCTASSNEFSTVTAALEHAARCAINGATGH
jgi:hypothetical protein